MGIDTIRDIVRGSVLLGAVLGLSAVSCGSSPQAGRGDGGLDGGSGLDGASDVELVQVSSMVVGMRDGAPIAGATVCIVGRPTIPCATTGNDGKYTISIPAWTTGIDLAFNVTAPGHLGSTGLVHETPGSITWLSDPLYDDAGAASLMGPAGFPYPAAGKAFVLVSVFRSGGGANVGVTASVLPASSSGPVYMNPVGTPDPTLTGVTSNGYLLFGNLEPGKIEITVSDTSCTPVVFDVLGWASTKPNSVAGETVADSMAHMTIICR